MATIIAIFVFVVISVVALVGIALYMQRTSSSRLLRQRLESIQQAQSRDGSAELDLLRNELLSEIPALNRYLSSSRYGVSLRNLLAQAAVAMRPGMFLSTSLALGVFGGVLILMLSHSVLLAAVCGIAGCTMLPAYVYLQRSRRFKRFEDKFPDAIDLLGRSIRAGHAFTTALELIADESPEPIAGEFRKLFEEQKFGLPLRDALLNLAERVPLIDVKFFSTAVLLQRETGGNLAELLDKLSFVIRERFKILRQVRVYTAQGRLTLLILMVLPPALACALSVLNPEFIKPLLHDPLGHNLIAIGIVLQSIGFLIINKIIHIKV